MLDLEPKAFWQIVDERALRTPDRVLGVDDHGNTLTCVDYRDRSLAVAAGLAEMGIGTDTRVSWQLPTNFDALVLTAALSRLGAVQNPIIPIYREREVGFCVRQTEATLLISAGDWRGFDYTAMAEEICADLPTTVLDASAGLPTGDPETLPEPPVVHEPDDQPVRWIYYTSGTTSDPKGALHTDWSVIAEARSMWVALELTPEDNWPLVFPFTHIGGNGLLLASLVAGPKLLVSDVFDPAPTTAFLAEHDMTVGGSGAFFFMAYLNEQRKQPDTKLFPNLRCVTGGGSVTPVGLHYEIQNELGGSGIMSSYGLTEIPIVTFANFGDPDDKLDKTEGRAAPGYEFKVVGLDGTLVAPGQEGELYVRGPSKCRGYLDESLNAAAFDDEGYFKTGDLGVIDEDGYVAITGRAKDVIIRNGENISAKEVEDLLFAHSKVREVAVVGIPDPKTGERACAVVVLADPDQPLEFADMQTHLKDAGLMIQKVPERLEFLAALPRNPAGKILKKDLRASYSDS